MRWVPAMLSLLCMTTQALADSATLLGQKSITTENGAAIYQHVCQGCHQIGGRGAVGAGYFPALAGNKKLAEAGYPVGMVLNGNGGMPWFNGQLTDAQIADVVNYVRTHFGNRLRRHGDAGRCDGGKRPGPGDGTLSCWRAFTASAQ